MRLAPTGLKKGLAPESDKAWLAAFTLAEVLAAMAFVAIVIPIAAHGIRIANLSGVVAERKATASRIADRVINELVVTSDWKTGARGGNTEDNGISYRWEVRTDGWARDGMKALTVTVFYPAQGQEYEAQLTTLVDTSEEE